MTQAHVCPHGRSTPAAQPPSRPAAGSGSPAVHASTPPADFPGSQSHRREKRPVPDADKSPLSHGPGTEPEYRRIFNFHSLSVYHFLKPNKIPLQDIKAFTFKYASHV